MYRGAKIVTFLCFLCLDESETSIHTDDGNANLYDLDGNYIGNVSDFEATGLVQNAKDEAVRRSTLIDTYLTPLECENTAFDANSKTDEISEILKTHKSVEELFSSLVPQEVTYEEFWERYFYRCDEIRKLRCCILCSLIFSSTNVISMFIDDRN